MKFLNTIAFLCCLSLSVIGQDCPPGSVTFTTQEELDGFAVAYPNCTEIAGDLKVNSPTINNLGALSNLTLVEGDLDIRNCDSLLTLEGLENLEQIGVCLELNRNEALVDILALQNLDSLTRLSIYENNALTNLVGLENISDLFSLGIRKNNLLTNIDGLNNLTTIDILFVEDNEVLTSLSALGNVNGTIESLKIVNNEALSDIDFGALSSVSCLTIENNESLINLTGLDSLTTVERRLLISNNNNLISLQGLNALTSIGEYANSPTTVISNNASLENIEDLENLQTIRGELYIENNPVLVGIEGLPNQTSPSFKLYLRNNEQLSLCSDVDWLCDFLTQGGVADFVGNTNGCNDVISLTVRCYNGVITYVKEGATGDGSSWGNATGDLQAALDNNLPPSAVWVAEGTYFPTTCDSCSLNDRSISFTNTKSSVLLGGFPNNGDPDIMDRDLEAYPTILNADIGQLGDSLDNSFHVFKVLEGGSNPIVNFIMDGFYIVNGLANDTMEYSNNKGAGVFIDQVRTQLSNCVFINNTASLNGGAVWNAYMGQTSLIQNCLFNNNSAEKGGAVFADNNDSLFILNSRFNNNFASAYGGGVYLGSHARLRFIGNVFYQNSASRGGGIYASRASHYHVINSSTFVENVAFNSGKGSAIEVNGVQFDSDSEYFSLNIWNSIFWGNNSVDILAVSSAVDRVRLGYCLTDKVEEMLLGDHIEAKSSFFDAADPFMNLGTGDLQLNEESQGINTGRNSNYTSWRWLPYDVDGNERIVDQIDMGAYEYQGSTCSSGFGNTIYVNQLATGDNSGTSWVNAFTNLHDALESAYPCRADSIWLAEGIHLPEECWGCDDSDPRLFTFATPRGRYISDNQNFKLSVFGGFPNTGNPSFLDRDVENHATIISGNIGDVNTRTDNSYNIILANIDLQLDGITIEDGYANDEFHENGAGITSNEDLVLNNCIIQNNYSSHNGGAIYGRACEARGCYVTQNYSGKHGGFYSGDKLSMFDCLVEENSAVKRGGVFYSKSTKSVFLLNSSLFFNNNAESGGVIYVDGELEEYENGTSFIRNSITVDRSQFHNNFATANGGVFLAENCEVRSYNSIFNQNSCTNSGGVLRGGVDEYYDSYSWAPSVFYNCNFLNNSGNSASVMACYFNRVVELKNCIFWNNNNPGSYLFDGSIEANNSIFDLDSCQQFNPEVSCGNQLFFTPNNPFVDFSNDNFLLNDSSIAIGNGILILPDDYNDFDLLDSSRIAGSNIDIGAIEYQNVFDNDGDGFYSDVDCDDANAGINPGILEIPYNGIDDDCDPTTPDDDLDQDGFTLAEDCDDQNVNINQTFLEIPNNDVDENCDGIILIIDEDMDGFNSDEDCDDLLATVNPDAIEIPYNGMDDDCDPSTLDDDLDQDGFILAEDCDDQNPNINPDIVEIPYNGIDDDCDPSTLDDDLDQDGFSLAEDCDDQNANINPDIVEIPYNGIDDDCDANTLDDDLDQDGFTLAEDCDDQNPNINPDILEIPYNSIDDDCDATTLDDDLDQDGFILAEDCDDQNPSINPDIVEIPYNGIDDDCEATTLDDDLDQDGYILAEDCDDQNPNINPAITETPYNGIDDDCNETTLDDDLDQDGYVLAEDCDDQNPNINPAITETPYNGIDDDCNETTLDDDLDQDGFPSAEDCDDENPNVNPGAIEIPDNGIDEDCDGADPLVSTEENVAMEKPQFYPNPTSGKVYIVLSDLAEATLTLNDYTGKIIQTKVFQKQIIVDLSNFPDGVYIVCIQTQNVSFVEKIIKVE